MAQERVRALVQAHEDVYAAVLGLADGLGADAWSSPTGCPGWDVKDQLSHIIGVERTMLGEPDEEVELPDLPHLANDFARAVEPAVHLRRARSPHELVMEAEEVFARRRAALDQLEDDDLDRPMRGAAGLQMKGSQMLRLRVFDLACHEYDIRRAVGEVPDGTAGQAGTAHLELTVEQILRLWGRTWGATDLDGYLEVEVAGFGLAHLDLASGALERDGAGQEPRARWRLEVAQLLALAGGRTDAPGPDEVFAGGDQGWAAQVHAAAGVTP